MSSLIFIIKLNIVFGQNYIEGNWRPQTTSYSCWASSLSNVSRANWNASGRIYDENFFLSCYPAEIPFISRLNGLNETLDTAIGRAYKFRYVIRNKVLSYKFINNYFDKEFSRPLGYSFGYNSGDNSGHFVIIYGTYKISNRLSKLKGGGAKHTEWLCIYDPKPDNVGSYYVKNYSTYQIVDPKTFNNQGTFYHFIDKDRTFAQYNLSRTSGTNTINPSNSRGLTQSRLVPLINVLSRDSFFREILGENYELTGPISILDLNISENNQLLTVESQETGEVYFTRVNEMVKGLITVEKIDNNKYLIDRIEDAGRYRLWTSPLYTRDNFIFKNNHDFRFLYYEKGDYPLIIDLDNFFRSSEPMQYDLKTFFEKFYSIDSIKEVFYEKKSKKFYISKG